VYYANVDLTRHMAVLKSTYFIAVIEGVFYLDTRMICKRETLSVVTLVWSKIMCTYNTPDTMVKDKKTIYDMFDSSVLRSVGLLRLYNII